MSPLDIEAMAAEVVALMKSALAPLQERLSVAEARLAAIPSYEQAMGELRERVVVVETKAAIPPVLPPVVIPPPQDLSPVLERVAATEATLAAFVDLRDRVTTIETKAAQPLPAVDFGDLPARLSAIERQFDVIPTRVLPLADSVADLAKDFGSMRERMAVLETRPQLPGPPGEPGAPGRDGIDGSPGVPGLSYQGVYQDGKSYDLGHVVTWAGSTWHANESTTAKPGDGAKSWTLMVKRGRDGKDGRDAVDPMPVVRVGR